jgi:hypothetical protein
MRLQIETPSYNDRRYGKPYIATVDFSKSAQGEPTWGEWVGQPGKEGLLILEANPGEVVMRGQKDSRNTRNSAPDYFVLGEDGTLRPVSKPEAYKHAQSRVAA